VAGQMSSNSVYMAIAENYRTSAPCPVRVWRMYWVVLLFVPVVVLVAVAWLWRPPWLIWLWVAEYAIVPAGYIFLVRFEKRVCRRNDNGLRCWECQYIVDRGIGERCSECGMNIAESAALWELFRPGRFWSHPAYELRKRACSANQARKP
jgi:hypothetical protein